MPAALVSGAAAPAPAGVTAVALSGGNVVEVDHLRDGMALDIRRTGVEIVLETRRSVHSADVVASPAGAGYPTERARAPADADTGGDRTAA